MKRAWVAVLLLACAGFGRAQMVVEKFAGPVTKAETESFLRYVSGLTPDDSNQGNRWSYGPSGAAVRAIGLVYEIDHDTRLLDQMIRFCDADLAARNDLAPAPLGQHVLWTGRVDPAWPNDVTKEPIATGGEQGDPVGNLAYCASLILQSGKVLDMAVPDGDARHYGKTYRERAKKYVREADASVDGHILNGLLDLSHGNRMYFSAKSPYKGGTPVPWNQVMMFDYAFQHLFEAHRLLGDDAARQAKYHKLVMDSLHWFFNESVTISSTGKAGRPVYDWGYAMPQKGGEDATHAGMDVAGFVSLYDSGDYGLGANIAPFANTLLDVMTLGPRRFAGRVDGTSGVGHSAETVTLRSGYLLLAEFRPEAYAAIVGAALTEGGSTKDVLLFARYLSVKNRIAKANSVV